MSLYSVITQVPKPALVASLKQHAADCFPVHETLTIVRSDGSAKALLDKLELSSDERRGLAIFQISADYYGFASKAFWDWLAAAFREDSVG